MSSSSLAASLALNTSSSLDFFLKGRIGFERALERLTLRALGVSVVEASTNLIELILVPIDSDADCFTTLDINLIEVLFEGVDNSECEVGTMGVSTTLNSFIADVLLVSEAFLIISIDFLTGLPLIILASFPFWSNWLRNLWL